MHLIQLAMFSAALIGLLAKDPPVHTAYVIVIDRTTNAPIAADVQLGQLRVRTVKGKATFLSVGAGKYPLSIFPDDPLYPTVSWSQTVPQTETAIFRLEKIHQDSVDRHSAPDHPSPPSPQ